MGMKISLKVQYKVVKPIVQFVAVRPPYAINVCTKIYKLYCRALYIQNYTINTLRLHIHISALQSSWQIQCTS